MAATATLQWPDRVRGLNFYQTDRNLQRFLQRSAPAMLARRQQALDSFGAYCGGEMDAKAALFEDAKEIETQPNPTYPSLDLVKSIRLDPDYVTAYQELYRRDFLAPCLTDTDPESNVLPLTVQYLTSQTDIGLGCPWAMSYPESLLIRDHAPKDIRDRFLPELRRTDGQTPVCGTWASERHSGSDIGNTETKAVPQADGTVQLFGHNYFCSAFGFSRFLGVKPARPEGAPAGVKGLMLTLVPSALDPAWQVPNDIEILRLKKKMGTRDLATAEIRFNGTIAYPLAPQGQGVQMLMDGVINCSRVHNAMAAAGVMRRALMETLCWDANRVTFNKPLMERTIIRKRILDIQTEWLAGCALAFEASRMFEETRTDPTRKPYARIVTALAKYRTAEQAMWCMRKAMEMVGGNALMETHPLARLNRDAHVLTLWEGPEQMQAKELMSILPLKGGGDAWLQKLEDIAKALPPAMQADAVRLNALHQKMTVMLQDYMQDPKTVGEQAADEYLHKMSDVLAYALLCEEGAWELQHCNDLEKALFADRFYQRTFVHNIRPDLTIPLLQKEFARVVGGQGVDPALNLPAPPGP